MHTSLRHSHALGRHEISKQLTFIMVLPLMTQVMLAGGLLLEVIQDMCTVSPPLASSVPDTVTRSGPTEKEKLRYR